MSLKGSLNTVALPEVLEFLASTAKSGQLRLTGSRGEGRLWLDGGRIRAFEAGLSQEPADALFELLRYEQADFTFEADCVEVSEEARTTSPPGEVKPALETAQQRLTEWQGIVSVVPSLDHQVRLSAGADHEVILSKEQWALIVAVSGGHRVGDVVSGCQYDEFTGCAQLKELVEMKLLAIDEPVAGPEAGAPDAPESVAKESGAGHEVGAGDELAEHHDDQHGEQAGEGSGASGRPDFAREWTPTEVHAAETNPWMAPREEVTDGADASPWPLSRVPMTAVVAEPDAEGKHGTTGEEHDPDHYAELRAAIVAAESMPAYEDAVEPAPARASLDELLARVAEEPEDAALDSVDGRAERGPWPHDELAAFDGWSPEVSRPEGGDDHRAHKAGVEGHDAAEAGSEVEAEAPAPGEEPINRGLLLKFLSSVRN